MAKRRSSSGQKSPAYWLKLVAVAIGTVFGMVMFFKWYAGTSTDSNYGSVFESQDAMRRARTGETRSSQDSGPGLRESGIRKLHGNGYDTY